jgi:segregation and condensation protein B
MEENELQAAAGQPEGEALPEAAVEAQAEAAEGPAPAASPEREEGADAGGQAGRAASDGEPIAEAEELSAEQLLGGQQQPAPAGDQQAADLKAVLEAIVYVLNEPMPAAQIAQALGRPLEEVEPVLRLLAEETSRDDRGIFIREVAGGYQMATKPEHHEVLRNFVKNLKQPLKLSQAALETLAVIAYKQPITMPEILEIRGVQGGGVVKTLIDRKLITTAGRKNVIGKPMLYKTTKEFLTQFGLKDIAELPSLKEFEEIRRQSIADEEFEGPAQGELPVAPVEGEQPQEEAAAEQPAQEGAEGEAAPEAASAPEAGTGTAAGQAAAEPQERPAEASAPPERENG